MIGHFKKSAKILKNANFHVTQGIFLQGASTVFFQVNSLNEMHFPSHDIQLSLSPGGIWPGIFFFGGGEGRACVINWLLLFSKLFLFCFSIFSSIWPQLYLTDSHFFL